MTLSLHSPRRFTVSSGCVAVGLLVALAIGLGGPPGVDQPAHLFQTWLFEHAGFSLWNNLWYAGRYEFVNYSILYYPLAAVAGETAVAVVSCAVLAGSFAVVARREWGDAANLPSFAWAITAPFIAMVSGVYPFLAGAAAALLALALFQRSRRLPAVAATVASLAFSPLAFALLVAVLFGAIAGRPRPLQVLRVNRMVVVAFGVVALLGLIAQRAFASGALYPYSLADLGICVAFSAAGLWLAGRSSLARPLRMLFAAYLLFNLAAFVLRGPLGSNSTRLFGLGGLPLLWLAANVGVRRSRWLVVPMLAVTLAVQLYPFVNDAYASWDDPAAARSYWTPVLGFLAHHHDLQHRVEVVATWGHWEAYYLARHDVPLARGWFRQDDFPTNSVLYRPRLTGAEYRAWLRSLGVRYVFLPDTELDYSALAEAALLRSGHSGLQVVDRTTHWVVYELPRPTAIVASPAGLQGSIVAMGPTIVRMRVSGPGSYLLRVRYSPYWELSGAGTCASLAPDGMTTVSARRAGTIKLWISPGLTAMARELAGNTPKRAC